MLNPFPILLSFALLAPFILRVIAGLYFVRVGMDHLRINRHTATEIAVAESYNAKPGAYLVWGIATIEVIGGLMLLVGFLTQIAALVLSILILIGIMTRNKNIELFRHSNGFYFLILAICFSLLFSGAGFLAFDLPL